MNTNKTELNSSIMLMVNTYIFDINVFDIDSAIEIT